MIVSRNDKIQALERYIKHLQTLDVYSDKEVSELCIAQHTLYMITHGHVNIVLNDIFRRVNN
jgi:hypothetical protein